MTTQTPDLSVPTSDTFELPSTTMQIVVVSGTSGSGKSVALKALEDSNYYVVDNLPAVLLLQLVTYLRSAGSMRVGVAVDMRSGASIRALPTQLRELQQLGLDVRVLFLNARDETLIARFSETRRRHPLARDDVSLGEAISLERSALEEIAEIGHHIDTSDLHPNSLRTWIHEFLAIDSADGLTLMFQSFGFKYGLPLDADLVFDVRCLPNPFYDPVLRPLTGLDQPVIDFLCRYPEVTKMAEDIRRFVANWLPSYVRDNRSYLSVAIGCTGGQHRSVYVAEWLARQFHDHNHVLVRHRSAARRASDRGIPHS